MNSRGSGERVTILLIEDHADSRDLLKLVLETLDCRVLAAANADEALRIAESSELDLIFTDFGLPGMNGAELVRRLRKFDRLRKVPIVMLSAFDRDNYINCALASGCDAVLAKPVDIDALMALTELLLKADKEKKVAIQNFGAQFTVCHSTPTQLRNLTTLSGIS